MSSVKTREAYNYLKKNGNGGQSFFQFDGKTTGAETHKAQQASAIRNYRKKAARVPASWSKPAMERETVHVAVEKWRFRFRGTKIRQGHLCHQRQREQEDGGATRANHNHEKAGNLKFYAQGNHTFETEGQTAAGRTAHQPAHTPGTPHGSPSGGK